MNEYKIPDPVNTDERYYHAMVVRLDALCHMVSSLVEHIAKQENVPVEENTIETDTSKITAGTIKASDIEKPKPRRRTKKE